MRVLVLGVGLQGKAAVYDFLQAAAIERVIAELGKRGIEVIKR